MPIPPDPRTAIAALLKAKVEQAEGRVFRPELPKEERAFMPRAAIVVFAGGGGGMFGRDRLEVWDSVLDIAVYGSTREEAENIADEALYAMRNMGRELWAEILVHWIRIAGGVKSAIDPETNWPFAILTVQAMTQSP